MEVENYEKISKFKIICIKNSNTELTDLLTIDEALLEIKRQKEYWYSEDNQYTAEFKFSNLLDIIYNQLLKAKEEADVENSRSQSEYASEIARTLYYEFQDRVKDVNIYTKDGNYIVINLNNLRIYTDSDISICNIKTGYVYCLEHNYDERTLNDFLRLYNKNTTLSTYINHYRDSSEYKALLLYLSLETKNYPQTNGSAFLELEISKYRNEIQSIEAEISKAKVDLSGFNKEYKTELENWKKEKEEWYKKKEDELRMLRSNFDKRTEELEKLYSEKLKLDEPCKYWESKSNEFKKQFRISFIATVLIVILILAGSYFLITNLYSVAKNIKTMNEIFPISFITLAVVSLMIYLLRTCIKFMMSNKHLETEYKQKSMFTYFYLSLLENDKTSKEITESEKNLIYSNLFSNPDTGLVKASQDNNDITTLINAILKK